MTILTSPWASVDNNLLIKAAKILLLTGERVELKVDSDSIGFAKYGEEWSVISTTIKEECPWVGGLCKVGSCMNGKQVEDILKKIIDKSKPKQISLF